MLPKSVEQFIKSHEDEALELLKTLAQIPAPSHHEEKRAQFCRDWLITQGAKGVYIDDAKNVIYPVEGEDGGPFAVYGAHLDVVFPDEEALPLAERNGRIYCPGIGDDTACVAALLLAAKYAALHIGTPEWEQLRKGSGHLADNITADGKRSGILFVLTTGEEGLGNLKGIKEICRVYGERMQSFCSFDSVLQSITDRAVGSVRYRVSVDVKGGHSFHDFGAKNAIEKLSGLIQKLYRIKVPGEGHTTYNVGTISGGTTVNAIAQHAEMLYEYRSDRKNYLDYMEEQFHAEIEAARKAGTKVAVELLGARPCGTGEASEAQKRLSSRAVKAVEAVTGKKPASHAGSTDCNMPLSLGIPSVCMGCYNGKGEHTREEYIETASLKKGYRVVFEMIYGR